MVSTRDYSYFYSSRGSLTEKRPNGGGASTFYNYSTEGELLSVTLADGKVVKYESDGLGRRISRSYNGETLGFIYKDQLEPIADVNSNGSVRSVYVYAEKAHIPSYMIRGAEKFAFINDERGSVRMVVAMSSGVVVQELRYDSWGRVLLDSSPGFQPFGYAGGIYDEVTGLVRFGARDYEAGIGRWLSKDPITFNGGQLNFYVYVGNDSVNWIDFDGMKPRTKDSAVAKVLNDLQTTASQDGRKLTKRRLDKINRESNAEISVLDDSEFDDRIKKNNLDQNTSGMCYGFSKTKQIIYIKSSHIHANSSNQNQGLILHELRHTLQHINGEPVNEDEPNVWQREFHNGQ